MTSFSRRDLLKGSTAVAAGTLVPSGTVLAAAPPATAITPALIKAAQKEGAVTWYTAADLALAEKIARTFEAKFSGVKVRIERNGSERIFQRIAQETRSKISNADVVNSSDAAHYIVWKREGMMAPFLPEDVAKHYAAQYKDADGLFASFRLFLCPIAYNTNQVKATEAPKSYTDLLGPKWVGKIAKGHPSYSGTVLTSTYQISRDLGWSYFEKLAKQKIMQLQSAVDVPKKVALGERAIAADGVEYVMIQAKEKRQPMEIVYPTEGTPLITSPSAVFTSAPHPNAARLLQAWCFSPECQEFCVNDGGLRTGHAQVKDKKGRTPLSSIKLMKDDPAAVERLSGEIKKRYSQIFKV
jgi:iron(III) transport system substrate-binding protein